MASVNKAIIVGYIGKDPVARRNHRRMPPNGNAGVDMYDAGNGAALKSPTSCDTLTADVDIREDSMAEPDGSAITRNETRSIDALEPSANHYATRQAKNGDSATREGTEDTYSRESGSAAPTTFSRNMRKSAKTRDTSASCRYAPPSCSPEDGNHQRRRRYPRGRGRKYHRLHPVILVEGRPPSEKTATRHHSSTVEQRLCKAKVSGSNPDGGSKKMLAMN